MEAPLKATVWIGGVIVRGAAATPRSSRHPALCADLSLAHTPFMWREKAEGEVTAVCAECVLKDSFTEGHSLCYYGASFIITSQEWPRTFQRFMYTSCLFLWNVDLQHVVAGPGTIAGTVTSIQLKNSIQMVLLYLVVIHCLGGICKLLYALYL